MDLHVFVPQGSSHPGRAHLPPVVDQRTHDLVRGYLLEAFGPLPSEN